MWVADTIGQQKAEIERLSRQLAEAQHECIMSMQTIAEERARAETAERQLAEARAVIERQKEALEQAIDDFGAGHSVCEFTKQLCIDAAHAAAYRTDEKP